MMKKLLLLSTVVFAFSFASKAQSAKQNPTTQNASIYVNGALKTTSTPTVVVDTLHYYLNKVFYKAGTTDIKQFPYYKSAASTATGVSHVGSRFDVPAGDSVIVTGLEAYARKHGYTANLKIFVNMMLCDLDANGMPVLPPIDSIVDFVNNQPAYPAVKLIGGNFAQPRIMKKSFAILFRNMSTVAGDTVHLFRTNGAASTSTASIQYKYSDSENGKDYSFARYSKSTPGTFYSTRNFSLDPGFGVGTQYEFIVAPRVTYTIQAGHLVPQGIVSGTSTNVPDTMCTREIMTFTNTSSKFYEHRMYNLNPFFLKWAQGSGFVSQPPGGFSPDSAITWSFEFFDQATPPMDSRVFLPYNNNNTITAQTDLAFWPDCFTSNEFRARLRPMGAFNTVPQLVYNETFTVCLRYCNGDTVGVKENGVLANVSVYPNPAVNGKTNISGLKGSNTIMIYNAIGQLVSKEVSTKPEIEVDLNQQPKGTYIIRVVNEENQSRSIRILHQN